jgi:hypothetical protein
MKYQTCRLGLLWSLNCYAPYSLQSWFTLVQVHRGFGTAQLLHCKAIFMHMIADTVS